MNVLGKHLLLELKDCNQELLDDLEYVREAMLLAVEKVGASVVGETFHRFSPHGVTGVLAIAESHLSIHTWPEYGYAAADIFTCGSSVEPEIAAQVLIDRLESRNPSISVIRRGTQALTPIGKS